MEPGLEVSRYSHVTKAWRACRPSLQAVHILDSIKDGPLPGFLAPEIRHGATKPFLMVYLLFINVGTPYRYLYFHIRDLTCPFSSVNELHSSWALVSATILELIPFLPTSSISKMIRATIISDVVGNLLPGYLRLSTRQSPNCFPQKPDLWSCQQ